MAGSDMLSSAYLLTVICPDPSCSGIVLDQAQSKCRKMELALAQRNGLFSRGSGDSFSYGSLAISLAPSSRQKQLGKSLGLRFFYARDAHSNGLAAVHCGRLFQNSPRLSVPPNNVVKIVESASKMFPACWPVGGIHMQELNFVSRRTERMKPVEVNRLTRQYMDTSCVIGVQRTVGQVGMKIEGSDSIG